MKMEKRKLVKINSQLRFFPWRTNTSTHIWYGIIAERYHCTASYSSCHKFFTWNFLTLEFQFGSDLLMMILSEILGKKNTHILFCNSGSGEGGRNNQNYLQNSKIWAKLSRKKKNRKQLIIFRIEFEGLGSWR